MNMKVSKSEIYGEINIPGSKSHTIRAMFFATLAEGVSHIKDPLHSKDTLSALETCRAFGATIEQEESILRVTGIGGRPSTPEDVINTGNSGTTLRLAASVAGLCEGYTLFTGDEQVRSRPMQPLIKSINELGGTSYSARDNGKAPFVVKGRMKGGKTSIDAVTSQFLSSLLITAPLLEEDTFIEVRRLNEVPYVDMTLSWLNNQRIIYSNEAYKLIHIKGRQKYSAFSKNIPGDFSSATFFIILAAISGGSIILKNLDKNDIQGDKRVLEIVRGMGASIIDKDDGIIVKGNILKGMTIDMNDIPDALPALAVLGCFAEGETKLLNVPQARLKETDRIMAMYTELKKMGADIEELEDGLVIRKSKLRGCEVKGHYDHRIVMSLAVAGLCCEGETVIDSAEAMEVTFPEFGEYIKKCGGNLAIF